MPPLTDVSQADSMIVRIEKEQAEKSAFIESLIGTAGDQGRDLTANESQLIVDARSRIEELDLQLDTVSGSRKAIADARARASEVHRELSEDRRKVDRGEIEYRSTGAYLVDAYASAMGDRGARERLEIFERAAAHQKTSDNPGIVPDPIIGEVVNFVDGARPLVTALGVRPLPSATWYRPKVTQRTLVQKQGAAGAPADEKSELVSQKMTITRVTGNAVTYGGYVNVSRQDIDLSSPSAFDIIVQDLATQYAIETEKAAATALDGADGTPLELAGTGSAAYTAAALTSALWTAAGEIYTSVKGAGRLMLAVPPAMLGNWGQLFAPINPQNAQSNGFNAADFSQGLMGQISGIPVIVSAGLPATTVGVVFSTAAVEVYEQRVGQLQVVEPSVLGVQVAYAGYFTPMVIEAGGVYKIVNAA
jgi:HK97 family phage major capsid protein